MKYFQLIFLVFCGGVGAHNGGAVLDPSEPLKWTYSSVIERSRNLTYADFEEKVAGDLQRFVTESGDSLQLKDPEKSVAQRLETTRGRWTELQEVCPNERHQRIILATAMEFLDCGEFQKGYFSGGEVFWTLKDYLRKPEVPDIFWDATGKSIIALYYLMKRHPSIDRCSISREDLPRGAEDFQLEPARTFRAPSGSFVRQFVEARTEDLARAVRALQVPHDAFVKKFVEEGKVSLYHVTERLSSLSKNPPAAGFNETEREPRSILRTKDPLSPRAYLGDQEEPN